MFPLQKLNEYRKLYFPPDPLQLPLCPVMVTLLLSGFYFSFLSNQATVTECTISIFNNYFATAAAAMAVLSLSSTQLMFWFMLLYFSNNAYANSSPLTHL